MTSPVLGRVMVNDKSLTGRPETSLIDNKTQEARNQPSPWNTEGHDERCSYDSGGSWGDRELRDRSGVSKHKTLYSQCKIGLKQHLWQRGGREKYSIFSINEGVSVDRKVLKGGHWKTVCVNWMVTLCIKKTSLGFHSVWPEWEWRDTTVHNTKDQLQKNLLMVEDRNTL